MPKLQHKATNAVMDGLAHLPNWNLRLAALQKAGWELIEEAAEDTTITTAEVETEAAAPTEAAETEGEVVATPKPTKPKATKKKKSAKKKRK